MRTKLLSIVLLGMSASLVSLPAHAFSASFHWCSGSPAFSVSGVPKGTTKLVFQMVDLNKPEYNHGGGTVTYKGQRSIPCGAFNSGFNGPSPPAGQVHTYQFYIDAVGANGQTLAKTTTQRKFPQ